MELALNARIVGTISASDHEGRDYVPFKWGFGAGIRYYFDAGRELYPYLGALTGFQMLNDWTGTLVYDIGGDVGLLIAINDALAVDISIQVRSEFVENMFQKAVVAPTCLGLRYFF